VADSLLDPMTMGAFSGCGFLYIVTNLVQSRPMAGIKIAWSGKRRNIRISGTEKGVEN